MTRPESSSLYARARNVIPGGVNSPVRAFGGVGGSPVFFKSGSGARLIDADGNEYLDYVGSWGPLIQGHSFQPVVDAVTDQSRLGTSFGAPTEVEIELATRVCQRIPSIERVRMVNSGTESTMSAIRLARGYTGRDHIVKFEGCFHGHGDSLLVKAGSGVLTLGLPDSPGVPESFARHTITVPYNDTEALNRVFDEVGPDIAGVIVEPIAGNMGCIPPVDDFLRSVRAITHEYGSLLIFDEVMTGFRVARGGAQQLYEITPDLTTLGKIIGGGLPVGAFGGRSEIMDRIAPDGPVYQSGTLSGNPLAMRAGIATLDSLTDEFYVSLAEKTAQLTEGLRDAARDSGVPLLINETCGMFGLFFTDQREVHRFADVSNCDADTYSRFFHGMLERGVYFAPSAFEVAFMSGAHTSDDIAATISAASNVFGSL